MKKQINVAAAPKTDIFQMQINPEIRQNVEAVYAQYGLSLAEAIDIFLQESLNASGFPFPLSPENEEYRHVHALKLLMAEIQKGLDSVKTEADMLSEEDAYRMLDIEP